MQKIVLFLVVLNAFFFSSLYSNSLRDNIDEVLKTNPKVQERLKIFRSTQQDLHIAESEYYPKVDLKLAATYNRSGLDNLLHHDVRQSAYENYESSLILTQNLFNGFSTTNKINYQKAKILSDAYKYIETADEMGFKMAEAYIKVFRTQELLESARENVKINRSIYNKVKELSHSGLINNSEVKKINSSLSLAKSKLTVQKNSAVEAQYNYKRILGRMPDISNMQKPDFDIRMPSSVDEAALYAIEHNPSMIVSRYDIQSAQSQYKEQQKGFYPKLDLEFSKKYNDVFPQNNGFDSADDRFQARIVLTYNLFQGGSDTALLQKNISKINQEIEIKRDLKRKVIEKLELAWTFYKMTQEQLKDLKEYGEFSKQTMSLYKEEYGLGRRTLLDLLSAQNDVINSKEQIIQTEYDMLFAKYRILDAMGMLVQSVVGDNEKYGSKVNLSINSEESKEILDIVPVKLDVDNDNISDNKDLCDNSIISDNILETGCKKLFIDSDKDGVADEKDLCPLTTKGVIVSADGCEIDSDLDGVVDSIDECKNTQYGKKVSITGCEIDELSLGGSPMVFANEFDPSFELLDIYYNKNSYEIPSNANDRLEKFIEYLNQNLQYNAIIVGHAGAEGNQDESMKISQLRAKEVMLYLVQMGIDRARLTYEGRSDAEPIAFGTTEEDMSLNRRVEIELTKEKLKNNTKKDEIKEDTHINLQTLKKTQEIKNLTAYKLDINYAQNSFTVPKSADKQMDKFSEFLKNNLNYKVLIIGHTSSVGKDYANLWLSKVRAKYIVLDLINRGIDKSRLSYDGKGDTEPISFGNTPEDLALNRRIEVKLFEK